MYEFTEANRNAGRKNLRLLSESIYLPKPVQTVAQYAEYQRTMPSSTPFPGRWRNDRTPYLVEPMDTMSAYSPTQRTIIAKGAQLGFTAAAENVIAYWMDISPTEIMFISATEVLLQKWVTKRLEPMIDSCGLRSKIFAQTEHKRTKRTGDKTFSKEFIGGNLDMASAQSPGSLRSDSKRVLIRDEIDGAPRLLTTGEGDWLEVSLARTNAYGARRKIFDFSTPTTFAESAIWAEYETGDQRRFYVPCPHCGQFQKLEFYTDGPTIGLKWEVRDGHVVRAWYVCEHCRGEIRNWHKPTMLTRGEWRPTSQSYSPVVRSYQISSLYSPPGMLSWEDIAQQYLRSEGVPDKMRAFTNLVLGLPYRETGARPELEKVIELRGGYRAGTVPDGVIFLTAAIDVQRGSEKDPENPPRVELEVCGHGLGYRTWSILYQRFEGEIDDPQSGAWEAFDRWCRETKLSFLGAHGRRFGIRRVFVDSGDGPNTETVYRFVTPRNGFFPTKGFNVIKKRRDEKADDDIHPSFRRYRSVNVGTDKPLVEVNTAHYKNIIYSNLKISRADGVTQKPGFCDFPSDYGSAYFEMLTAEEKRRDGSFYCPSGRRNEALDVRVLNLCAADMLLHEMVLQLQADAKHRGVSPDRVGQINSKSALDAIAKTILAASAGGRS